MSRTMHLVFSNIKGIGLETYRNLPVSAVTTPTSNSAGLKSADSTDDKHVMAT